MILSVGGSRRPNNEAVANISYQPQYDVSRRITFYIETWEIVGRIVNYPVATQRLTTAEIGRLKSQMLRNDIDLVFLEDSTLAETALKLKASECVSGPSVVDFSFPNNEDDVYATGIMYRVTYSAKKWASGNASNILEFEERIVQQPGGREYVYVGGAVNMAERQLGIQAKPWRYVQAGQALGAFAHPRIPPPIWPFALTNPDGPKLNISSPRVLGRSPGLDTEFAISWEYEYEWHQPLRGLPYRRYP